MKKTIAKRLSKERKLRFISTTFFITLIENGSLNIGIYGQSMKKVVHLLS